MTKNSKVILSITSIIVGWLMCGFGFTTTIGHPLSTICLLTGIGLSISGIIFLNKILNRK